MKMGGGGDFLSEGGKGLALGATDYVTLARVYIQALNQGAVPTITDAWTEVLEG